MRSTLLRRGIGALALAMAIGGMAWSFAPDAATSGALLHPAESIVYFSYDGGAAHEADFRKTAAYASLYESGMMESLTRAVTRLKDNAVADIPDRERLIIGQLLELGKTAFDRGVSVSLVVAPPADGLPTVSATAIVNQGAAHRAVVEELLREALANEPNFVIEPYSEGGREVGLLISGNNGPIGAKITLFEKSGHLVLNVASLFAGQSAARDLSFNAINGGGANVSAHRLYRDGAAEKNFVQNGIAWFDFQPLKEMFGEIPLPPTKNGVQLTVNDLLNILGLNTLEAVTSRSGFRDRAVWSEASVLAPGPRTGLMALIDQPTFTLADLPALPSRPLSVFATGIDAGGAYDRLIEVFKNMAMKVEPEAIDQFEAELAKVESQIGFSIRQDLLGPLSGAMVLAADGGGSQSIDSVQVSLQVSDGPRFQATLQKIFGMIEEASAGDVTFDTVSKYGREMSVMRIRQAPIVAPTICIDRKYAHIGLLPQAVDMILLRTDGKLPGWKPAGDAADALQLMPAKMTGFSYSDAPMMYTRLLGQAPLILGFLQTGMAQVNPGMEFPLRADELPPAELFAAPLFPNISVSTVDADGAKSYSRNSLPGSEAFLSAGGIGIGVALLLPAVQQAREAARRVTSANNMKMIGLALHNYHDVHNTFPPGTMPNAELPVDERLSWLTAILPYLDQAALYNEIDRKAAWNKGANETATATSLPGYLHPGAIQGEPGRTSYVGLAGLGENGPTLEANNPKAGAFAYDKARSFRDFRDGFSNTAIVAESNLGNPWAQGGISTVRPLTQQPYINGPDGIGGVTVNGANILFADGSVRFVNENVDARVMEAISTIAGGEIVDDF